MEKYCGDGQATDDSLEPLCVCVNMDWTTSDQNKAQWSGFEKTALNFWVTKKIQNFMTRSATINYSRKTL
jgi:hypothetical protein